MCVLFGLLGLIARGELDFSLEITLFQMQITSVFQHMNPYFHRNIIMTRALLISFLLLSTGAFSQVEWYAAGARSSAMNNTGLGANDVWSVQLNQAGLANMQGVQGGLYYNNQFGISELGTGGLVLSSKLGKGGIGFDFQSFGYSAFRQSDAGISYGLALGSQLNVGVRLGYRKIQLGGIYGQSSVITAEGGFQYGLTKDLLISGHISNPQRSSIAENGVEKLPSVIRTGVQWSISEALILNAEVRKDVNYKAALIAGVEYAVLPELFLMLGAGSGPDQFSFGAGYAWNGFRADVAASYHQILGFSPQLSVAFNGQH
jgi:hypothetical protein